MSWRHEASASIGRRPPRRGRCPPMRACLLADGLTSSPPAGSLRWTGPIPPWPSSWGRAATRRPASSPTLGIVGPTPGWPGFHRVPRLYLPPAHRPQDGRPGRSPPRRDSGRSRASWRIGWISISWARRWNTSGGSSRSIEKRRAVVNREFLDWLSRRRQPERPFFAFLNYFDAHHPYELPEKGIHRFGVKPRTTREATLLRDWRWLIQKGPSPHQIDFVRDSYDDCVADLDEQLGRLIDELDRRSCPRADLGDHHRGSRRELRRTTRRVLARDESLPDAAPCSPGDHPPGGGPVAAGRHRDGEPAGPGGDDRRRPGFPGRFSLSRRIAGPVLERVVLDGVRQGRGFRPGAFRSGPAPVIRPGSLAMVRQAAMAVGRLDRRRLGLHPARRRTVAKSCSTCAEDAQERHNLASDPAMRPTLERMRGALDHARARPVDAAAVSP